MKYEEARIGMQVLAGGPAEELQVVAEIDGLDDDLELIHVKPVNGEPDVLFSEGPSPTMHEVEGWRSPWQYDICTEA